MIALAVPNLGWRERAYSTEAVHSGWIGPSGPFVEQFEESVARAADRKWAIATITGTAALHASVWTLWRKDIVVPEARRSFPAMLNVITQLNGMIYPGPDNGGVNHDLQLYENLRREWDPVIADRAPAIGEPKSDEATVECYSFAANKIVTCGHGGAIVGDDPDIEARLREEIRQGYGLAGHFNYRMANINAAIGVAQMERLDELKAAKRRIWDRYADAGLPMVQRGDSRWMATIDAPRELVDELRKKNIQARSEPSGISIPCSTNIEELEQDRVITACINFLSL